MAERTQRDTEPAPNEASRKEKAEGSRETILDEDGEQEKPETTRDATMPSSDSTMNTKI